MRPGVFYNLDNARDPKRVAQECDGILSTGPGVFGFCEGFGYRFNHTDDYRLLHASRMPAESGGRTPGRLNVGAYVHRSLDVVSWGYTDSVITWERPDRPGQQHWARSTLHAVLEDESHRRTQLLIGHRPPTTILHDTGPAQAEWDAILGRLLTRGRDTRRRVALCDWNGSPNELAAHVGGRIVGHRLDAALTVNVDTGRPRYVDTFGGVKLRSDHGHAFAVPMDL